MERTKEKLSSFDKDRDLRDRFLINSISIDGVNLASF